MDPAPIFSRKMTSDAERRLTSRRGPSLGGLSLLAPALLTLTVLALMINIAASLI